MEDVLQELQKSCSDYNFWYMLYAEDLVIVVNHYHLDGLIDNLHKIC